MDTNGNTKELIKDLCSRLPYGVILKTDNVFPQKLEGVSFDKDTFLVWVSDGGFTLDCMDCKPYLFPLSSMTEEQQEEFDRIYADDMQVVANNLKNRLDGKPYETNLGHYRHIDWLNANHFDYRGLITKGLAIDATGLNIY